MQLETLVSMRSVCPIPELDEIVPMNENKQQVVVVTGPMAWISKSLGIQPWGQVLILALIGSGILVWNKLDSIDKHLTQNDISIKTLPLELSKELLSQAETDVKFGRLDRAARVLDSANAFLIKASVKKLDAPPQYFQDTRDSLNSISEGSTDTGVQTSVHTSRVLLATYRSALEPSPKISGKETRLEAPADPAQAFEKTAGRTVIDVHFTDNRQEILNLASHSFAQDFTFEGPIILAHGATQTLDGIHWRDVVFVGAHIKYLGGNLDLQYVHFVNCTFDISPSPHGNQFLDYAALAQNKFSTTPPS